MNNPRHQKIADYVRTYMLRNAVEGDPISGARRATARYWHTLNVYRNVGQIIEGEGESADMRELCEVAALFHDVDSYTVQHQYHAARGAETAARFLRKEGYPEDFIKRVAQTVRDHDQDFEDDKTAADQVTEMLQTLPRSSLIVIDADVLDKIGVSNIMAALMQMGRTDKQPYEAARELTSGWPLERAGFWHDLLTTRTGQALGEKAFMFYQQFLDQLKTEVVMNDFFAQPEAVV